MNNFTHLHVHSFYSFLDGKGNPDVMAKRAKELGMTSLALTDHNSLAGIWHFQKACKAEGIKPILGLEAYWTWDTDILSLDAKDRKARAVEKAKEAGVEIPDKINGKKPTQKQINELIAPYEYDTKQYHLILLAKSQKGWQNLINLQSEASEKCTYNGRFICDDKMLEKYSEDIIVGTACIGGVIPQLIAKDRILDAEAILNNWINIFGKENLFLEIQPLNQIKQHLTNLQYVRWSKEKGIKLVATNDVHYVYKEEIESHDILVRMSTGKTIEDVDHMGYEPDFWIRDYREMLDAFERQHNSMKAFDLDGACAEIRKKLNAINESKGDRAVSTVVLEEEISKKINRLSSLVRRLDSYKQEIAIYHYSYGTALNNTNLIADMIEDNIKLGSDHYLFPNIDIPAGLTAERHLIDICYRNLFQYKKKKPHIDLKLYEERLCDELRIINTKGFAPYMLTIYDIVAHCEKVGIPVGPGRGSAAGSLVLFMLGVTKGIDPIEYQLLFFRFLTMDRTAMPDVDTDFSFLRRPEVIKYLETKYGHDNVANIGTYTLMGVKNGIKDVGRVLNMDFGLLNSITKKIDEITDEEPSIKFKSIDELANFTDDLSKQKYAEWVALQKQYPRLFELAREFEGTPRNMGVHASGVLITPEPVNNYFPTRTVDGKKVALYTGPQLEEANAVKLDILGLATLDVIDLTLKSIDKELTLSNLYETVSMDDKQAYQMICRKETEGLFQIESNLFKSIITDMQPTSINDIIALTSLGRPGPLQANMHTMYNNRKNGIEDAVEPLPNTWDIVKDTYGCIVYQEQIMLLAKRVAHFDDNQTDSYLRKALAKKQREKMDLCKQWFIYGKINSPAPVDYDEKNLQQPMYDPKGKYGPAILGGVNNGYTAEMLSNFWDTMEGYAKYLFNKSHAACYSLLTNITAVLKSTHCAKFFAALLSLKDKEDVIESYIKTARKHGIRVLPPSINDSEQFFVERDGNILYSLSAIKGVGASSIPEIIAHRPYTSLTDAVEKIPKKYLNKRVGQALIKSGAFNFENDNRYELLNQFIDLRKDKDDHYDITAYNKKACMDFERETVTTPISHLSQWDLIANNSKITLPATLTSFSERPDKNGRTMGFLSLEIDGDTVKGLMFASSYGKVRNVLEANKQYVFGGNKDDKGTYIINSVKPIVTQLPTNPIVNLDDVLDA